MKTIRGCFLVAAGVLLAGWQPAHANPSTPIFRVGAFAMDVTPTNFPVIVNGGFLAVKADHANDSLHMRWLVLDDGATRVALGVLDTCLIPREFADEVKKRATQLTGIPSDRIMLSATHTHTAPSLMQALGTPMDPHYPAFVMPRIVEGLQRAVNNLAPARVGWTVAQAPVHTHTRVWIRRPDRMMTDPFGVVSVRAMMHPGYQSPDVVGPVGPSDPALTLLAVQSPDGRPIAVLANYSMHYFGSKPVSADYYGVFAEKIGPLIGAKDGFVGIMSQGTSGDQHWMDYSQPKSAITMDAYAGELARIAADAYKTIQFHDRVPLVMAEKTLRLATRQPDAKRLAWARELMAKMNGRTPKDRSEVYAPEQFWLKDHPTREAKLQALRVGDFGIAIWPCEVFAITGLKIKAQSPLQPAMNIELANAEEGYIPPPELHPLGGYNTWACRSAGLEVNAEPKMVEALLGLLEQVSGQPRRKAAVSNGTYAKSVLAAKPLAYWRLEEWSGSTAFDAMGGHHDATYETGVARWLDGPPSSSFSGAGAINHCPHFAGGRLSATLKELKETYTVEFWFWNGLPNEAHPVTGYVFGRGGESLAIGGTARAPGSLVFGAHAGHTILAPKTWNHAALVRDGSRVAVYLNGNPEPEISGTAAPEESKKIFVAGDTGGTANFEGKMDEIAVYQRALSAEEIHHHYQCAGIRADAVAMNPP
jgi:Concanavalin A-like lectin/glucanases superfamily